MAEGLVDLLSSSQDLLFLEREGGQIEEFSSEMLLEREIEDSQFSVPQVRH